IGRGIGIVAFVGGPNLMDEDLRLVRDMALQAAEQEEDAHRIAACARRQRHPLVVGIARKLERLADAGGDFEAAEFLTQGEALYHVAAGGIEDDGRAADIPDASEGFEIADGAVNDRAAGRDPLAASIPAALGRTLADPLKAHGCRPEGRVRTWRRRQSWGG